jgi:hypothetical protein
MGKYVRGKGIRRKEICKEKGRQINNLYLMMIYVY